MLKRLISKVVPYLVSLATFFAFLQLVDLFSPRYLVQIDRFWELATFETSLPLTIPLAILSFFLLSWMVVVNWRLALVPVLGLGSLLFLPMEASILFVASLCIATSLFLIGSVRDSFLGLIGVAGIVEVGALLQWLVFEPLGLANPLISLALLELNLHYLFAQLSPLFMLIFAILGVVIPVYHFSRTPFEFEVRNSQVPRITRSNLVVLGLILALSVVVAIYPYLPNVNPHGENAGVDIDVYYLDYLRVEADPGMALSVSGGSRPLFYFLLFGLQRLTFLDALSMIRWAPVVLNPMMVVSIYFLASEMFGGFRAAAYAGFFTAAGFTLSAGMYAYFLADMFMLSLIFASLGFLFRSYRKGRVRDLVFASVLGCLLVFTHPWTLDQYLAPMVATIALVAYAYVRHKRHALSPLWLAGYCLTIVVADVVKLLLLKGSVDGVVALGALLAGFTSVGSFWLDLVNSSRFVLGGFIANVPLLFLAVIGLWRARSRSLSNIFILLFVAMSSAVYFIGDVVIKSRILYNLPIGVLAAYGFLFLDDLPFGQKASSLMKGTLVIALLANLFRELATLN